MVRPSVGRSIRPFLYLTVVSPRGALKFNHTPKNWVSSSSSIPQQIPKSHPIKTAAEQRNKSEVMEVPTRGGGRIAIDRRDGLGVGGGDVHHHNSPSPSGSVEEEEEQNEEEDDEEVKKRKCRFKVIYSSSPRPSVSVDGAAETKKTAEDEK
ncbi:hypothetical protein niasHT_036370 [Heterodera trifolii]|uniref:Uncharacterized protein n=1 Tax=Heterodera trifolii TaxID=157864 RepID=A0ABD2J6M2_9BILA